MATDCTYPGRELEAMSFALNYHRWILDVFAPYLGKRIVEVGAGSGAFSELLLQTGPEWFAAIEPSSNMFPLLADHLRRLDTSHVAIARQGNLTDNMEAVTSKGSPDSILYVNVLEHIADDSAELASMYSLLRPKGHALIFVPANRWLMGSMDHQLGHYRRYTMGELRSKCEQAGFVIRRAAHFDFFGVLPWWIKYCLLRSKSMEPGAVRFYDNWVVPIARSIETRISPPVGKNLLIVALKN